MMARVAILFSTTITIILKILIVGMYSIITMKYFNLFLREAELRFNLIKKTKEEKINNIKLIFKKIYENCKFEFGLIENF